MRCQAALCQRTAQTSADERPAGWRRRTRENRRQTEQGCRAEKQRGPGKKELNIATPQKDSLLYSLRSD